jgi:hypothetical protein
MNTGDAHLRMLALALVCKSCRRSFAALLTVYRVPAASGGWVGGRRGGKMARGVRAKGGAKQVAEEAVSE